MGDDSDLHRSEAVNDSPWAQRREQREDARIQARLRYRDHLIEVLAQHGVADPIALADATLDALLVWRYVDSDALCRCSCHPQLPDSDLHDFGLTCPCTQSEDERRHAMQNWRHTVEQFWSSPEGQRFTAAEHTADAELADWLATQHGVTISRHGGFAPEQWSGEVEGHRFEFRERHGQWDIEIDQRPSGRFIKHVAGTDPDGSVVYRDREIEEGDHIASGATADDGYGSTHIERARFIIDTVRTHLARQTCSYHLDIPPSLDAVLGTSARWCPLCGTRVAMR